MSSVLAFRAGLRRPRLPHRKHAEASGSDRGPAAPKPHPKRLGLIRAVRALHKNPIAAFARLAYEEPIVEVDFLQKMLLVSEPAAIEHVLVSNAANYRKSIQQQRRLKPALGEGLLTVDGEAWRSARRITSPLFNPRAIAALFEDMRAATADMQQRWRERESAAAPLDMAAEFQRLTYEIVSRTVFSGALDEHRASIHANMAIYFDTFGRIDLASLLNLPGWFPTPASLRARPALKAFRSIMNRTVAERMAEQDREIADLLDRLLQAPDPKSGRTLAPIAVSDNLLTFLAAGHETTGNALAWILYLLSLYPDAERKVVAEIEAAFGGEPPAREELDGLTYTRAVVNEAMRLYPPAPFIGREAIAADEIGGRQVAPGTQILISPWIVHRHRTLWEEPDAFRPERFMGAGADAVPRGAFIPFGLGPRVCIGQGFAMQEILTVLAAILPNFRFRLADSDAVFPESRITLRSRGGVPMFVASR